MDSLKVKVSFTASMLEDSGLVNLGRFYGEDLDFSSWWRILTEKISVSGRMELAADMDTYTKISTKANKFGMTFSLLYLS